MKTFLLRFFTPLLALVLVGAGCVGYGPASNRQDNAVTAAFGQSVSMRIGETVRYDDGLKVTFVSINDSRCPEEVQCIWAGELSTTFRVEGGGIGASAQDVQLGTVQTPERVIDGYMFTLMNATTTSVKLLVSKNTSSGNNGQSNNGTTQQRVTITGTFSCLPHKDTSGPITLECAFGLRGEDGVYYALDMNSMRNNPLLSLGTGTKINVKGTFTPIEALSSNHWQKYDIKGILTVSSIETTK